MSTSWVAAGKAMADAEHNRRNMMFCADCGVEWLGRVLLCWVCDKPGDRKYPNDGVEFRYYDASAGDVPNPADFVKEA
jgi:hypothetical protein